MIRRLLRLFRRKPWKLVMATYDSTPTNMTLYIWDTDVVHVCRDGSVEDIPTKGMQF